MPSYLSWNRKDKYMKNKCGIAKENNKKRFDKRKRGMWCIKVMFKGEKIQENNDVLF